jgi:carboxyvinyl-carboxyphosphonate phosphorylmutase
MNRLRPLLAGDACLHPASVHDPLTARVAADLGYESAILGGSAASLAVLGAPDLILLTLTELAELTRRITRAGAPPLLVDADHGYGNALNVMRTLEELEAAGAAGATIEDTVLPRPFGETEARLIPLAELVGKISAARSAAREILVVGRTAALSVSGVPDAIARAQAMEQAGAEALFFTGLADLDQLRAIEAATRLPLILGGTPKGMADAPTLARHRVRLALQGHLPIMAALEAVRATLAAQRAGLAPGGLPDPAFVRRMTREATQAQAVRDFLS